MNVLCFRMTKMKNVWRCDECGEEWESSYYDTFDDVDVRYCFTGPHTAVVELELDSDEECLEM